VNHLHSKVRDFSLSWQFLLFGPLPPVRSQAQCVVIGLRCVATTVRSLLQVALLAS
jgi:hypothetical protein